MCSSSSLRKYRIPVAYGSVASRSWSHSAEPDDVGREVGEQLEVGRARQAGRDPVADLADPARPDAARDRLAARLVGAEAGQESGEVDDAGALVRGDDRARADVGARPRGARRTRTACRAGSAGSRPPDGPPTRTALRFATGRRPARRCRGAASRAGPRRRRRRPVRGPGRGSCPGCAFEPIAANASGPVDEDPRDGGEGLDVLDDRRPVEQAALRRVRRPLLGLAALALERLQEDRLLAEHVGALDRPDGDRDAPPGAEHGRADEARRPPRRRSRPRAGG